mmetsp:Transcript_9266/g.16355  ORF Transcript_9266/g.16355 Transcript_9266/m.16355 type:complete len:104 (+) Transcript_9266:46-357(+)|eukprot:CAMPEP_0197695456 /NCGR_PEP_ID=MMETSP1338-20131121/115216_1 /TAXON_ID=43686 ORGANISM="Pelagodinium beii, Strain RCC1491" /NCGR_SAMPLE_ID=MMETSP1338 /ASSEMBLY_ACC=CAM_ASM_000754 /LENGTH=103 /DNA_ID=CAMNT_0043278433 /DNA_START=24 /DNA_END=335 /DNA_ORIENTATION=-
MVLRVLALLALTWRVEADLLPPRKTTTTTAQTSRSGQDSESRDDTEASFSQLEDRAFVVDFQRHRYSDGSWKASEEDDSHGVLEAASLAGTTLGVLALARGAR